MALALVAALAGAACSGDPISSPLRALQSAGPVSFVCLGSTDDDLATMAMPLRECTRAQTSSTSDFSIPHLYTLVTQPLRGEVAVVDLTTTTNAVLDQDARVPGSTFLPIGGLPTDIASTPGGTATFVTVAEPGFEGIYALPSDQIRDGKNRMSSWPSCSLPAAPGALVLAVDPANADGSVRQSCDGDYGTPAGALADDADEVGTPGRFKLIVSLPSEGGLAVIDAQALLDTEAGAFAPCAVERWLPLEVSLPTPAPEPTPDTTGQACTAVTHDASPFAQGFVATPAGLAIADQRLYVADRSAPVVHRVDLGSPCDPRELPPLVATSDEDPSRVVTTTRVAVSPPTLDLKRYLYAVDVRDGSLMVFDVSDGAASVAPLKQPTAPFNPFQPTDRIRFQAPVRDVAIVQHQGSAIDEETGASLPVRCDPSPEEGEGSAVTWTGFEGSVGPTRLRGVFAFAVLESGAIVVIDVDDYDAPCRRPSVAHPLRGCDASDETAGTELTTSEEFTCNAVEPHQTRSAGFLVQIDGVASNQPGLQSLPVLFDQEGTVLSPASEDGNAGPAMRATLPVEPEGVDLAVVVSSRLQSLSATTGMLLTGGGNPDPSAHTLAFNLEEPRSHILNQVWRVTYEGALPGFSGRFVNLVEQTEGQFTIRSPSSRFCSRGVLSQRAVEEMLVVEDGLGDAEAAAASLLLADYVQVVSETPVESDTYWQAQSACTFNACRNAFGTDELPRVGRDLRIVEATEDAVELEPRSAPESGAATLSCCFPGVIEYRVRAGQQWVVNGESVGFLHRVVPNEDGVCRNSCDPNLARSNGRVRTADSVEPVTDGDRRAFINPFFRFAILPGDVPASRGMQFQLATQNAFSSLVTSVIIDNADAQPQAIRYLSPTGELVVSDGSLQGITMVDLGSLLVTRQYN